MLPFIYREISVVDNRLIIISDLSSRLTKTIQCAVPLWHQEDRASVHVL